MSDGQRSKPAFEPPPWEREAFEELARKRAAEEAAEQAARSREEQGAAEAPEAILGRAAVESARNALAEPVAEVAETADAGATPTPAARTDGAALDDKVVEAMLMSLQAQEPRAAQIAGPVSTAVAVVMGLIGVGVIVASIVFVSKASGSGNGLASAGAIMLGVMGLTFVGGGVYVWYRATRGKGSR